ncbi:bifunctional RNA polymerase subunit Rpb4-RPC9/HRDC-like superfamily/DNA-directed RNA polymerase II subunit Rpb4-like/Rpb4-RPC9 superfamily/RNA polymerase Rpb4-RPC9 [Babesia duncani]|uniref:Bifunctional RNA polymerase subunit Rpb4-RPC9/HRDC-like superfamily/DNA-directed RNA polymerase II subunit Rpb4-like/Rpb4-RPC9 superfamily/RNA polymerase Rpb4-RPC9 n=1 Tax=Babesia duncani TaxID=323732 RepID=A0AAD9PLM0_9APIC|nr:bifunctional RNA polymerase subunit Rpb4-RPC9/HRDC-like superfamily/DNA-directed RNA polymerase II subunit Rpb4-like/Rpb4-RPC9 superfamily/RNA polymerase Rpb4-RPC9 [Babesia duncani]
MDAPGGIYNVFESDEDFKNSKCLNLCELHLILGDQLRLQQKRSDAAKQLIKTSHEYASRFAILKYRNAIVDIRTTIERDGTLHEFEMASLVNLLPKSVEEAKSLIPSLSRISDDRINEILELLESYRLQS